MVGGISTKFSKGVVGAWCIWSICQAGALTWLLVFLHIALRVCPLLKFMAHVQLLEPSVHAAWQQGSKDLQGGLAEKGEAKSTAMRAIVLARMSVVMCFLNSWKTRAPSV